MTNTDGPDSNQGGTIAAEQAEAGGNPAGGDTFRRVVLVATAVVGGLALLGVVASALVSSPIFAPPRSLGADAAGVTQLRTNGAAGDLQLVFADVDEATLEAVGTDSDQWSLAVEGDELVVQNRRAPCMFGCFNRAGSATLTLPEDLNDGSLGLDLEVGAGRFGCEGQFSEVAATIGAGALDLSGESKDVSIELGAGEATLALQHVDRLEVSVAAGSLVAEVTGKTPRSVAVEVSVGSAVLTLPDDVYHVESQADLGTIDVGVATSDSSPNQVTADVSIGEISLKPGD